VLTVQNELRKRKYEVGMKHLVKITFLLMILFMVSISTTVTAETHRDLFGEGDYSLPALENMGYQLRSQLIYPDEGRDEGFVSFTYMNDYEEVVVSCYVHFYGSEFQGDASEADGYKEVRQIMDQLIEESKTWEESDYYEFHITSENDVARTLNNSYFRGVTELPIVARFGVYDRRRDDHYETLKAIMNTYIDGLIIEAKSLANTHTASQEETDESAPEDTVADVQKDAIEEKTMKVIGRVLNSDFGDEKALSMIEGMSVEKIKEMGALINFFNEHSPNQALMMSIVDFEGNELGSYGPVMTDKEGRFEFDYVEPLIDQYDLFVVMPLGKFPGGVDAGPSLAVKDWVYTGGTRNAVFLELAAEKIYKGEEKEIDLEDLYIFGGDTRRFISSTSKDTDFVNGFIYANSYLFGLMAENFYNEMVGYALPTSREKPLTIFHNANRVMPSGIGGNYDHKANYINLSDGLSTWFGMHDMSTAIYHEISHKVMFDLYGGRYPTADKDDWLIGTYGNQSTAHSLTEGFAYFMQNAISEYYGGKGLIDTSPIYGHIEPNFPAWFEGGLHEARAVSGVLYDLYDQGRDGASMGFSEDDDSVVIPLKALVNLILEAPINTVGQLYDKLIVTYPDQEKGINQIFIEHGFFSVAEPMTEELGTYHDGEAFVDTNRNFKYDAGETVINFNAIGVDGFRYQKYLEGAKIGYAAYGGNEARQMQIADPKFRIKTNVDYPVYAYDMTFIDEPYLNYSGTCLGVDGYVQMPVLPYNHNMVVSVYPVGQASEEALFTMTSAEIKSNYSTIIQQGYLGEWALEDLELSTDYILPLITMIGGESEQLQYPEQGASVPFAQLSAYDFTEPFIEKPYVRPQEVVDEVAIVIEEPVEETGTDFVASSESTPAAADNESGLMNLIGLESKRIIIIRSIVAAVSFLMLIGIIYSILKLIKR